MSLYTAPAMIQARLLTPTPQEELPHSAMGGHEIQVETLYVY